MQAQVNNSLAKNEIFNIALKNLQNNNQQENFVKNNSIINSDKKLSENSLKIDKNIFQNIGLGNQIDIQI